MNAPSEVTDLADAARTVGGDADRAVALAAELDPPYPGSGTADRWRVLTELSAGDLTAGRVAEAHLDAKAILHEADLGAGDPGLSTLGVTDRSTWGVFAAEGPGVRVEAADGPDGWRLTGTKPWCSLADRLSHALITAHTSAGRRLFAVSLSDPTVSTHPDVWVSRGLAAVTSGPTDLDRTPAVPVGADEWYLRRSGFAWGGMGVAACWFGGALGVARTFHAAGRRREPDQIGLMHLGAVDVALHRARIVLGHAAAAIDNGAADGDRGAQLAVRVRTVVAEAAEEILIRAGHAMGPAPLAMNEEHARRVADLTIYLRQHHAERDQVAAGRAVLETDHPW